MKKYIFFLIFLSYSYTAFSQITLSEIMFDPDGSEYYHEYITKSAVEHGLVPVYWDNGYTETRGFGLFNRSTGEQVFPNIIGH